MIGQGSLPAWITDHCQFGRHGEPFLWFGSEDDDTEIAIMELLNLSRTDLAMTREVTEFIFSAITDSKNRNATIETLRSFDK